MSDRDKKGLWFTVSIYTYGLPDCAGFYALYKLNIKTQNRKLLYIGTANNLNKRLKGHEIIRALKACLEYPDIISIKCKIFTPSKVFVRRCNGYYDLQTLYKAERLRHEAELIKRLSPPINLNLK